MIDRLSAGPLSVSELARPLKIALPSALKHLAVLEAGGIVRSAKSGRVRTFSMAPDAFSGLEAWVAGGRPHGTGSSTGWKLSRGGRIIRSALHTSFVLERYLKAKPPWVFAAWSHPDAKQAWSDCHADNGTTEYSLDFRPGGRVIHRAVLPDGQMQVVEKTFLEIVPDARIIFAYGIEADGRSLSASLVTVEFHAQGAGTQLRLTEQLAYLDGHMDLDERRRGTDESLDRLAKEIEV